jgi:hypothetical protein
MKNLHKTLLLTFILGFLAISITSYVQLTGENTIQKGCSYLDPIAIDISAFLIAIFLVIEGSIKIFKNSNDSLKRQLTRPIRIATGCAIITVHTLQVIHKLNLS